ncbi:MAG: hypothetical protein HOP02_12780 [Methylococcaceae bacterium]|nr:hypothetical protein [Methylococcaceae bacterium]
MLISNGGAVYSSTENDERGGSLTVSAQGNLQIDSGSQVTSQNAGDVNISAGGNILLSNSGLIKSASIKGNSSIVNVQSQGNIQVDTKSYIASFDAGDVIIGSGRDVIVNGGEIKSASIDKNEGNAGNVLVHANGDVFINGYVEKDSNGKPTAIGGYISSLVTQSGKGNSGNIDLSAGGKLTITNEGGSISTSTQNEGSIAGNVRVNVQGDILITQDANISSNAYYSVAASDTNTTDKPTSDQVESGKNGGINITSGGKLTLSDKGIIVSATAGNIHAGDVVVDVKGNVTLSNAA